MDRSSLRNTGTAFNNNESPVAALPRLIIIQGPTATGKSELAVRLAELFNGEIIGADSLQLYRGMEIGSAAPGVDLKARVRHHLIGTLDPKIPFTAADYSREATRIISGILDRGHTPFVVGGTGLYLKALLGGLIDAPAGNEELRKQLVARADQEGSGALLEELARLDPAAATRLHVNDRLRIIRALEVCLTTGRPFSVMVSEHGFGEVRYDVLKIGLTGDRKELYRRTEERVDKMIASGLVAEVTRLLACGYSPELKCMRAIGYKEICRHLSGGLTLDEAVDLIKRDTRRYLKRQLTWFLRDPDTKWFEYPESFASIHSVVLKFIMSGHTDETLY